MHVVNREENCGLQRNLVQSTITCSESPVHMSTSGHQDKCLLCPGSFLQEELRKYTKMVAGRVYLEIWDRDQICYQFHLCLNILLIYN